MSHPSVICGTCGRDNAPNLVFCQDCGARLGPRIAPPTPAIGLQSYDAPEAEEAPLDSFPMPDEGTAGAFDRLSLPPPGDDIDALLSKTASEPPKESRSRPSAPNFDFAPRDSQKPEERPDDTRSRCIRCGASNAPHIRYCLSCGNKLRGSQAPDSLAPRTPQTPHTPHLMTSAALNPPSGQAPDSGPPPSARPHAADQPIAPLPVFEIGTTRPLTSTIRICTRCRGVCESTAQFCKFCGASLVDTALASRPVQELPTPPSEIARPAARVEIPRAEARGEIRANGRGLGTFDEARQESAEVSERPAPPRPHFSGTARGRLIVIAKDGGEGASYPFEDRLDIGRIEGDVLVPDDPYISPRHARLSWKGKLLLRDLGSANGIYLRLPPQEPGKPGGNEPASEPQPSLALKLQDQDLILLGQQVIRFEVVRDAEEGLGPASQHGTLVFGTPAAPRYARLCLRTVEGVTRDVYYLGKRETILGRESGDIIFAEDPFLSRRHASIVMQQGAPDTGNKRAFALSDFGSSNGTFLQIRGEVPLESGSEFRVGQQLFRVELTA